MHGTKEGVRQRVHLLDVAHQGEASGLGRYRGWKGTQVSFYPIEPGLPDPLSGVENKLAINGVGDLAFEGPESFLLGLALGHLAFKVDAPLRAGVADLGHSGHVQGVVQPATSSHGESMHRPPTRRELEWRRAVIRGVGVPVGEATDVTGVSDQRSGVDWPHSVDLGERRPDAFEGVIRILRSPVSR